MLRCVKVALKTGTADSSVTKQSLEGEYPKLVRLFNDLWSRLKQACCSSLAADPSIVIRHPFVDTEDTTSSGGQQSFRSGL